MNQYIQRPVVEAVKISDHGKAAIIAELHEAIKIIDIENLTTNELNEARSKHQFVGRLIGLYLNDADRSCQRNPLDSFAPRQQPFGSDIPLQFRNPMYPVGYFEPQMQTLHPQQFGGMTHQPINPGSRMNDFNPSNPMNGTVMQNFMGQQNNPLASISPFGTQRPRDQLQWLEFNDTLLFSTEVRPSLDGTTLVVLFAERPAPGQNPLVILELTPRSCTCKAFNGLEVLTEDRLDMTSIRNTLNEFIECYIHGDKSFPHFSPTSAPLWNIVKTENPKVYNEWTIQNIMGEKISYIDLTAKQQA